MVDGDISDGPPASLHGFLFPDTRVPKLLGPLRPFLVLDGFALRGQVLAGVDGAVSLPQRLVSLPLRVRRGVLNPQERVVVAGADEL